MDAQHECNALITEILGHSSHVVRRGSVAIRIALRFAKEQGYKKVYIPDQGGWLSYKKDAQEFGFVVEIFRTDLGRFCAQDMEEFDHNAVLLVHSLAGYVFALPMDDIYMRAKTKDMLVINDVSGSVGLDCARYGDIIVGSFSKWKPVDAGEGGFIASSLEHFWEYFHKIYGEDLSCLDWKNVKDKLQNLPIRRSILINKCDEIAKSLKMNNLLYESGRSIVVIAPFSNIEEKERLIGFCDARDLPYTLCPRYIRVNIDAVSIEVKRMG